jgi:hypothetical protein
MSETWRQRRYREQHPLRIEPIKPLTDEQRRSADLREERLYKGRMPSGQNIDSLKK